MIKPRYHSSRPDHWTVPRPYQDATMRQQRYGKIRPMEDERPGFFARLFRWR